MCLQLLCWEDTDDGAPTATWTPYPRCGVKGTRTGSRAVGVQGSEWGDLQREVPIDGRAMGTEKLEG